VVIRANLEVQIPPERASAAIKRTLREIFGL
jgi:hypothetical protein